MASQTRTYEGPIARGSVRVDDAPPITFTRGIPVEVTDAQAKALDGDAEWSKSPTKPKGDKPEPKES